MNDLQYYPSESWSRNQESVAVLQEYLDAKEAKRKAEVAISNLRTKMVDDALAKYGIQIGDRFMVDKRSLKLTHASWMELPDNKYTLECSLSDGHEWRIKTLAELLQIMQI